MALGLSLGSHYNPKGYNHSLSPIPTRHFGDFGNICTFGPDGVAYYNYFNNITTISGSLNNVLGRGMVIHSIRDDGGTSYGTRIAACVVGVANPAFTAPIVFDDDCCGDPICTAPLLVTGSYYPAIIPTTTATTAQTTTTAAGTASTASTSTTVGPQPGSTIGSTTTSSGGSPSDQDSSPMLSRGASIAIGILVPLVVINLIIVGIWLYIRKKKRASQKDERMQPFLDGSD
jgi:hypothetical protein